MPDKEFFIRAATNEDIPFIKDVVFKVLKEYGLPPDDTDSGKDNDLNDIEKNYFLRNGFFGVVIEINTKVIIGTFGLVPIQNGICELRKMYLLKHARGKELGKLMLGNAIKISKQKKYKKIILETISPLKEAISLYKKFGFIETVPHEINERVDQAFELDIS